MRDEDIPIVEAIPVGNITGGPQGDCFYVEVPSGYPDLGFQVSGSPLMVTTVNKDSPVLDKVSVGNYIHGIILPDVEIVNLVEPQHLLELMKVNSSNPRRLIVSSNPFYIDPSVDSGNSKALGALYKHNIPTMSNLGFTMRGFPPVISSVLHGSHFAGRLHSGQTVEALLVPGQPTMNLAAGAFTSAKVAERLLETSHIGGRQLVVKDAVIPPREKGTSRPVDDCCVM